MTSSNAFLPSVRDMQAHLNYFLDPSEGGSSSFVAGSVGDNRRKHLPVQTNIEDMRGRESEFTLDRQGFQIVTGESRLHSFDNDSEIKDKYYTECQELLKIHSGASSVHAMSHVVRRMGWKASIEAEKDMDDGERAKGTSSANWVHVDQSYDGAPERIRPVFPELSRKIDAGGYLRWALVNVWRPIDRVVTRDNLAICDASTVSDSQLTPITAYFPTNLETKSDSRNAEDPYGNRPSFNMWAVKPPATKDENKWFYLSHMKPEEAFLLKNFDSRDDGTVARRAPHSAFISESDYGPDRQSIEVRCLVLWE